MLRIPGAGRDILMGPGRYPSHPEHDVTVDRHISPSGHQVPDFMAYFEGRSLWPTSEWPAVLWPWPPRITDSITFTLPRRQRACQPAYAPRDGAEGLNRRAGPLVRFQRIGARPKEPGRVCPSPLVFCFCAERGESKGRGPPTLLEECATDRGAHEGDGVSPSGLCSGRRGTPTDTQNSQRISSGPEKRSTSRPTMRGIFQWMEGIHWVPSRGGSKGRVAQ